MTRSGYETPLAIHRTFLADPTGVLMLGEGLETCLAVMQSTGHPAWAAMSTSGLRTLDLPDTVR